MLDEQAVDDVDDGVLFFGRQFGDGLEMQPQRVAGLALVFIEQQRIGADGHGTGQPDQGLHGRLSATGLVALDLLHMDAGGLGQRCLGVVLGLAQGDKPLGEVHIEQDQHGTAHDSLL